jgi:hypothetical protein
MRNPHAAKEVVIHHDDTSILDPPLITKVN